MLSAFEPEVLQRGGHYAGRCRPIAERNEGGEGPFGDLRGYRRT